MVIVLCGYTGGYTEAKGGKYFLKKIRNTNTYYKRITPAFQKPGSKPGKEVEEEIQSSKRKNTGSGLLSDIREVLKLNLNDDDFKNAIALIIFDDLDCRCLDEKKRYQNAVKNFVYEVKKLFDNLKIIFLLADPEIESWFCNNAGSVFEHKKRKEEHDAVIHVSGLPEEYKKNAKFNGVDSCEEKFSNKFTEILKVKCGLNYNKRKDGPRYLQRLNPDKLAEKDSYVKKGLWAIRNLEDFVDICPE